MNGFMMFLSELYENIGSKIRSQDVFYKLPIFERFWIRHFLPLQGTL